MKKLMIVAAALASTVAFADCERPTGKTVNCAEVYDVVLNLKTTICKCKILTTKVSSSECGRTSTDKIEDCEAWRQVVTKKVQGVIFNCICSCSENLDTVGSILDSAVLTPGVWDGTTVDGFAGNQYFWVAKDKVVFDRDEDLLNISWLARIGKSKNQVEAAGKFQAGIQVAGYGNFDKKNGRVKSITGYAAGVWGSPADCSDVEGGYANKCPAYQLCFDLDHDTTDKTFAAGTWSVKYNASKSKALAKNVENLWGKVVPRAVANYNRLSVTAEALNSVYLNEEAYKSTAL